MATEALARNAGVSTLEFDDMQGFIARGYGNLPAACYLILEVENAEGAREWLRSLLALEKITPGDVKPDDRALHLAFTAAGLEMLGLDPRALSTFSREFQEGMDHPHRARHVLGDRGASAPDQWRWGRGGTHLLVMLFARDAETLEIATEEIRGGYRGVRETARLDTHSFETTREHFGFNDGIAQPFIQGFSRTGPRENTVAAGEFILGYENAYEKMPLGPAVPVDRDPAGRLPRTGREDESSGRVVEAGDLGRNGTYLVFRQLSQNVRAFWNFIDQATRLADGRSDHEGRVRMAAKMVGRWPSGAPLTLCPERDDEAQGNRDDFGYRAADPAGQSCPLGAHIRRTNPRDSLSGSPEDSIKVSNRHRLLRRGRPYGAPLSRSLDVDAILAAEDAEEVGLHFICLVSDIGRQFEFVQHTWINNAKFAGLYTDADPLMGHSDELQGTFTIPGSPVRQRITGMKRFVEMRGGAYFFLPGMRALDYLANL